MPFRDRLAHDSVLWRRLARWGAANGPEWWVRYSPPAFGWIAALAVPSARRKVLSNVRRLRGEASPLRDAVDVARTFAAYAGCLAEGLTHGSKNERDPAAEVVGHEHVHAVLTAGQGAIFVTAHTGGWDAVGGLLARDYAIDLMMVMEGERDPRARALQDGVRAVQHVRIAHVGSDPLASLPLLRHVRAGGVVALQIDRVAPGMRTRQVEVFGAPGAMPEGPLKLAQLSGAPILPVFAARTGFRSYLVRAHAPLRLSRGASEAELDRAAQVLADAMSAFLREHPAQWFDFRE